VIVVEMFTVHYRDAVLSRTWIAVKCVRNMEKTGIENWRFVTVFFMPDPVGFALEAFVLAAICAIVKIGKEGKSIIIIAFAC
jgi:hypothetical protein